MSEITSHIRSFNRFYTNVMGLMQQTILDSDYSLTEARILFEMQNLGDCTANTLATRLNIDKSYMSRIIKKFSKKQLISKKISVEDSRVHLLNLTEKGLETIDQLIIQSNQQIQELIQPLSQIEQEDICRAMNTIKHHLIKATSPIHIRPYTEDDIDFIISNQINLYEKEYGFTTETWKSYITDGVQEMIQKFNIQKDCIYIVEHKNKPAGCVAITHTDEDTAQLRFFFVDASLRGLGAGNQLIQKVLDFCKEKKYKHIFLWTFSALEAARHLYSKNGFQLTETHENKDWGSPIVEEKWELDL